MSENTTVNMAIAAYAVYTANRLIIQIHEKWKRVEDTIGSLIDVLNKKENIDRFLISAGFKYDYEPDIAILAKKMFEENTELIDYIYHAYSPRKTLGRPGVGVVLSMLKYLAKTHLFPILQKYAQKNYEENKKFELLIPSKNELILMQGLWFFMRVSLLEPAVKSINDKRETRRSKSPLNGGRFRDAGVWPLLRAATAAGMSMRQLAELMVDRGVARQADVSRSTRIRKEAKRLEQARLTMNRLDLASPSAENL